MIYLVLIPALLTVALLERFWAPVALKALHFRGHCDHALAEPGEILTWTAVVENRSRLPIPFVRTDQNLPAEADLREALQWVRSHGRQGILNWSVTQGLSLGPWQRCSRTIHFSLPRRGAYRLGEYRLSAGDLLGLYERTKAGEGTSLVIMPEPARSVHMQKTLSGFLGERSVRRFLFEDPILTVGFGAYTGREPMKAISWTRTAQSGSLQVKHQDHTAEQTVQILLSVEGGTPETIEACFRLTRSVCERLERQKISFGLRTNGNLPGPTGKLLHVPSGVGESHLHTILYGLGRADYTRYHSLKTLVARTLRHRIGGESYILIAPDRSDGVEEALRTLTAATVNPVCLLLGAQEVDAQ